MKFNNYNSSILPLLGEALSANKKKIEKNDALFQLRGIVCAKYFVVNQLQPGWRRNDRDLMKMSIRLPMRLE